MKGVQKEREEKLARILKDFLQQYVRGDRMGFIRRVESEAERLSQAGQLTTLVLIAVSFTEYTMTSVKMTALNKDNTKMQ